MDRKNENSGRRVPGRTLQNSVVGDSVCSQAFVTTRELVLVFPPALVVTEASVFHSGPTRPPPLLAVLRAQNCFYRNFSLNQLKEGPSERFRNCGGGGSEKPILLRVTFRDGVWKVHL